MPTQFSTNRWRLLVGLSAVLLFIGCADNQYRSPDGKPRTWGEQHYLNNLRYQDNVEEDSGTYIID